jgi:hypothetical protein
MRRAIAAVVATAWLAAQACVSAAPRAEPPGPCAPHSSQTCNFNGALEASEAVLRSNGPILTVSCGSRMEESPVDDIYMRACVDKAQKFATRLSQKWSGALQAIDPGTLRYDWRVWDGCIDFLPSGGICMVRGEAKIPLVWLRAASHATDP